MMLRSVMGSDTFRKEALNFTATYIYNQIKESRDEFLIKGIFKMSCWCAEYYIEETGRSVRTRPKEHERRIRLLQLNLSAISKHSMDNSTGGTVLESQLDTLNVYLQQNAVLIIY